MICPQCGTEDQMAYSVFSNGLICLESDCAFEIEMSADEAKEVLEPVADLVCV